MKLQETRKKKKIKASDLAEHLKVTKQTISQYENGVRNLDGAKLKTLLKICNFLGCKLSDIIEDAETLELLRDYESKN